MKIIYSKLAISKIRYWVEASPGEISGIGVISAEGENILISDVYLAKQTNSGSNTILDPASLGVVFHKALQDYPNKHPRLWWHSHASMGVFWSGTDESCIKDWKESGDIVCSVFNKKGESLHRLSLRSQTAFGNFVVDMNNVPMEEMKDAIPQEWVQEYTDNCAQAIPAYSGYSHNSHIEPYDWQTIDYPEQYHGYNDDIPPTFERGKEKSLIPLASPFVKKSKKEQKRTNNFVKEWSNLSPSTRKEFSDVGVDVWVFVDYREQGLTTAQIMHEMLEVASGK